MFDDLLELLRFLFYFLLFLFALMCLPFVVAHVAEHWDAPEYPHSGFSPECPEWEAPENTLPPTHEFATCHTRGAF
ncbi:MAG: hypothetical protein IJB33_08425 [Akkermansia sp.]|nr:hypothetical protein [Akkermansia sp.]